MSPSVPVSVRSGAISACKAITFAVTASPLDRTTRKNVGVMSPETPSVSKRKAPVRSGVTKAAQNELNISLAEKDDGNILSSIL